MKKSIKKTENKSTITIRDVAKMAGVSIGTVSRAINDNGYISYDTKKKVMKIIDDIGFKPNAAARSMIKKKSSIVGVVVPEIDNPYLADLVVKIEEILSEENMSLMICNSKYKSEKVINFIDDLIQRNAEGLILVASELEDEKAISKVKEYLKVVSIGSEFGGFDCVRLTEWQAAYDITEYLISLGHKRIACIGFKAESKVTMERLKGYTDALIKNGLEVKDEYMLDFQKVHNTGYERTKQLLNLKQPPTAIFAINDFYALNSYLAVEEKGLKVGKDISIAGFDDISIAQLVEPSLTTVKSSTSTMAELAVELLMKRIRNTENQEAKEILIPTKIIKRKSTRKCVET